MFFQLINLIAALSLFFAADARAEEGFFDLNSEKPQIPPQVKAVWDASVIIASNALKDSNSGTAVYLGTDSQNPDIAYFLSCEHNFTFNCNEGAPCSGLELYHGYRYQNQMRTWMKDPVNGESQSWSKPFEVVALDKSSDLALLKVRLKKEMQPKNLVFASAVSEREKVFAIGAPRVSVRKDWSTPEPLSAFYKLYWSTGTAIGEQNSTLKNGRAAQTLLAHTADLLPGSSGGPLVNERGELVGINVRTALANQKKYVLSEDPLLRSYSFSVTLQQIKDFLASTGVSLQQ